MTAAAEEAQTLLSSVEIDEERFVGLLTNLIDNVETLQNNPSQVRRAARVDMILEAAHVSAGAQCQRCGSNRDTFDVPGGLCVKLTSALSETSKVVFLRPC